MPLRRKSAIAPRIAGRLRSPSSGRSLPIAIPPGCVFSAQSEGDKRVKSEAEMDVVDSAVAEAAHAAGVDLVIHGHTHKPAAHVGATIERWVVPDWELDNVAEGATGRSGMISFLEDGRPQIQMF